MPRGVPKAGFRMTLARQQAAARGEPVVLNPSMQQNVPWNFQGPIPAEVTQPETDEEILARITERFEILEELTEDALSGNVRALIVSGPPGLGKTFTIERKVREYDPAEERFNIVSGFSRATGLYRSLFNGSNQGQGVIYDDCDSIFGDEVALNLLKKACDTTDERHISWGAETKMRDDSGDLLPTKFPFFGSVIFVTNLDFEQLIMSGNKFSPHLQAMMDRALYLDLGLKTKRDFMIRIRQVCIDYGMLEKLGLTASQQEEVLQYMEENSGKLRELSIRTAIKIAQLMLRNTNWESRAKFTLLKQGVRG